MFLRDTRDSVYIYFHNAYLYFRLVVNYITRVHVTDNHIYGSNRNISLWRYIYIKLTIILNDGLLENPYTLVLVSHSFGLGLMTHKCACR